jgi:hypothetical protein
MRRCRSTRSWPPASYRLLPGGRAGKLQLLSGKHRAQAHALYRSVGLEAVAEGFEIDFDE